MSQLIERKNIGAVIAALARPGLATATLTVAGTGPLHEELISMAAWAGVADRVTFLGHVPYADLPRLLVQHSTLILASTEEVWGLVANEALAAGLHVVVTRACGVSRSISEMEGVWISDADERSLARNIVRSIDSWTGPVEVPQILAHTPGRFADTFEMAIEFAAGNAQGARHKRRASQREPLDQT